MRLIPQRPNADYDCDSDSSGSQRMRGHLYTRGVWPTGTAQLERPWRRLRSDPDRLLLKAGITICPFNLSSKIRSVSARSTFPPAQNWAQRRNNVAGRCRPAQAAGGAGRGGARLGGGA